MNVKQVVGVSVFCMLCAAVPGTAFAQSQSDNANVTSLFSRAKTTLVKIKKDAAEMESYTRSSGLSWKTHSASLDRIKADVNELGTYVQGLKTQRDSGSAWQQSAIDQVSPLMSDLATNMNAAIDHLNNNKSRPTAAPYPEYLRANVRIANDLSGEINDILDYAQAKATMDRLGEKLQ